jgi:hypothetical protein
LIHKKVTDALSSLQVPVVFQRYSGSEDAYITFHEYLQNGEGFEEDEEALTGHHIQVDVWSKSDYSQLVSSVKSLMKEAGFKRLDEADLYEKDTGIYHKGLRYYYLETREVN